MVGRKGRENSHEDPGALRWLRALGGVCGSAGKTKGHASAAEKALLASRSLARGPKLFILFPAIPAVQHYRAPGGARYAATKVAEQE
jgi:hypothetical protein